MFRGGRSNRNRSDKTYLVMTPERTKELLPSMIAHSIGQPIEWKHCEDTWEGGPITGTAEGFEPHWDNCFDYRVCMDKATLHKEGNVSQENYGGSAFPCGPMGDSRMISDGAGGMIMTHGVPAVGGMSLRDWFAGQSLSSMTAAPDYSKGPCNSSMAERAYLIADAMLKARGK
jgi:hypothetical protein